MTTAERIDKDNLDQSDVLELIATKNTHCLSIFLPTHAKGEDVQHRRDARSLHTELRLIRDELTAAGLPATVLEQRLAPLFELTEDSHFWRHQTQGLALFAKAGKLLTYRLPYAVKQEHRLSPTFHLLPLIPMLTGSGAFYLLALELERIRLFEGNREGLKELDTRELIPERLEERVGYDFEQKGLQYRSHHQAYAGAGYHGHDGADRDRHDEIARYFRGVDQGLITIFNKKPRPLLIASQEFLAAIYRDVSAYGLIEEEPIVCNLSECPDSDLHRLAWNRMKPIFEKEGARKWKKFLQYHGSGKASADLAAILPALYEGRVDSLFVTTEADVRGRYEPETAQIHMEDNPTPFTPSLLDWAVSQALQHGGRVYLTPEELPAGASCAALYRYA